MLACGTHVMGYATHHCSNPECPHQKKVCFSCKSRFCPTCGKKATDQWVMKQRQTLPDTEWQHITFTLPDSLWYLFNRNRFLLRHLSRLAARVIKQFAAKKKLLPGIFIALHTFGRDLKWNVHVHLSVTCGGLTADHTQWKSCYFSKTAIMPMWRYQIIRLLRETFDQLQLPDNLHSLCPTKQQWNIWLNQQYQKTWIVHFAKRSENHSRNINYLGRYIKRPPLSQSRLQHYDGNAVVFNYLDHRTGKYQTASFDTQTFFDRFTQHIPDKHFRMINYYGFLANRVRRQLLPKVYSLLDHIAKPVFNLRWRDLQKRSCGIDPLACILCGSPLRLASIATGLSIQQLRQHHRELALAKIIH
jgi:hypothetical protein